MRSVYVLGMEHADSILRDAIHRRDTANAEATRWHAEAARWSDFVRLYQELRGNQTPVASAFTPSADVTENNSEPGSGIGSKVLETESVARSIILETKNQGVSTRQLLDQLLVRGVKIGGKDPLATLTARLVRAPSLENVRPHGWRLKELRQKDEAAEPPSQEHSTASASSTLNDAVKRGEVAHDNMT